MEVAGIGLAALTLPGQIFSTSVVAYTTISQIQGMGKMFGRYYAQFKIQESRYILWGTYHKACNPGGLDESKMPQVIFERMLHTLIQINSLLEDRNMLVSRYGLKEDGPIQPAEANIIRRESERQQNAVRRLQKSSSLLRRVRWAVRDQARFLELVQQITGLIDALYECLPVQAGPYIEDSIRAETVAEMLLDRAQSGTIPLEKVSVEPSDIEVQQLQRIQIAAGVSSVREVDYGDNVLTAGHSLELPMLFDAFKYLDMESTSHIPNKLPSMRSWARAKETNPFDSQNHIVVEWRRYDPQRKEQKLALSLRARALVKMLRDKPRSDSFRVLECLGVFEDTTKTQFGITYRLPHDYNLLRDHAPRSLYEIISDRNEAIPYLGDRFHLAYLLSEAIHGLHTTEWLHKSICSQNILIFPKKRLPSGDGHPISLANPYFTGFGLARPDDPSEAYSLRLSTDANQEMNLYKHPAYKNGVRFRTDFDIFSLGIVLVELGTWRVAKAWLPKMARTGTDYDFRNHLLKEVVPGLGSGMGERYMTVVRKCLTGDFERLDRFGSNEYQTAEYKKNVRAGLLWEVVTVLKDCRA